MKWQWCRLWNVKVTTSTTIWLNHRSSGKCTTSDVDDDGFILSLCGMKEHHFIWTTIASKWGTTSTRVQRYNDAGSVVIMGHNQPQMVMWGHGGGHGKEDIYTQKRTATVSQRWMWCNNVSSLFMSMCAVWVVALWQDNDMSSLICYLHCFCHLLAFSSFPW